MAHAELEGLIENCLGIFFVASGPFGSQLVADQDSRAAAKNACAALTTPEAVGVHGLLNLQQLAGRGRLGLRGWLQERCAQQCAEQCSSAKDFFHGVPEGLGGADCRRC